MTRARRLTSGAMTLPQLTKIKEVAQWFLARAGLRLTPQKNWFVDSGVRRICS